MRNTIILTAILFITVIAAAIYYFKVLDKEQNTSRPLSYLPQNTLFIASIGNDKETENIFKDFELFDALIGYNDMKLWGMFKAKILNNNKIQTFIEGSEIYISFHPDGKKIAPLFTIPSTQDIPNSSFTEILNEISKTFKTKTIDTLNNKIYQIQFGEKDSILNAVYYKGILFASTSIPLVVKITDKHQKRLSETQIDYFLKDNPRKSALSIYFPHQQYDSLLNLIPRNPNGIFLNLFKKLHGQSAWNINFKQDALILTGESQLDQYPENYASLFKNQQKSPQGLYKYFPSNTAIYAEFSVSNRIVFQKDLHNLFKRRNEKIADQIDTTNTTELLNKALGDQFALVETNAQNYLGFVNITDKSKFDQLKNNILDTETDSIGRFSKSGILYKQYGDIFKEINRPYYTVIDSVLILANNLSTLSQYRKDYVENDLLTGTLGFLKLEKIQSKEANISLFAHSKNANSKILNTLKEPFRENFRDKENFGYQDFFSWSIQLSGNNGNISSQIYAIYNSINNLGNIPEWTFKLDERAITQPYVFNESDTSQFILIQELDHTLHAISSKGQKIWSKVFAGRIIGEIEQLDDRSIIFTTDKNNLYRIDTAGNTLKGFPIKLESKPFYSQKISKIKNQNIFLISTEKSIEAYDWNGNKLQNWGKFESEAKITTALQSQKNNYLFGTDNGHIYWLNDNGKKIKEVNVNNAKIENIHVVDDNTIFVLDNKGKINVFNEDAKSKHWIITKDTSAYFSSFVNINNKNNTNLTLIQNNQLQVFEITDTSKTIFQYNFTKQIVDPPQFFSSIENKNVNSIGLSSRATRLLYLFSESGELIEDFPVEGQPLFYYGKINYNSDTYLLCMRRDHKLYAFRHKK